LPGFRTAISSFSNNFNGKICEKGDFHLAGKDFIPYIAAARHRDPPDQDAAHAPLGRFLPELGRS